MARTGAAAPPQDEELGLGPEDEEVEPDDGQAIDEGEGDAADEGAAGDEEPGADADGAETEGDEPGDVAPRSRARDTIRTLRQRSQEAERRQADLQRQVDDLRNQRQPAYDPAAAARAEADDIERISMLPPAEQTAALLAKVRREQQQAATQIELRSFDRSDNANWRDIQRTEPSARRLAPEVERILNLRRQQGDFSLGREDIYNHLYGKELRERRATAAPKQRTAAQRRLQGQTTRPTRTGGDVSRSVRQTRDEDARREERLKNIRVGDIF